jgi:GT2 family glycosyltransferase
VIGERALGVVVPVRDGAEHLGEALASVLAHPALARVVVVDDGSTDASAEVARRHPGVELLRFDSPRGPAAARNAGLARLRELATPFVGLLDGDDRWPEFGAAGDPRLALLVAEPALEIVTGRMRMFRSTSEGSVELSEPRRQLQVGCSLYRASVFERVGPFDESLVGCEDFDWFARAAEQRARQLDIEEVTLLYRRHRGNLTADPARREHLVALPVRAALLRRRAARGSGLP